MTKLLSGVLVVLIVVVLLTAGVALYLTVNPPQQGTTALQPPRLAFVSDRDGNPEVYVMDGDGKNIRRLTENPAWDFYPTWSPDGTQIAFLRFAGEPGQRVVSEENGLYLVNADGSGEVQLVQISSTMAAGPAWSPDGTQIAYAVSDETQSGGGQYSIHVMSRQGGEPTTVLTYTHSVYRLDWPPDGTYLLFTSGGDLGPRASALDLTSGMVTELGNPAWVAACSSAGEEVAYFALTDGSLHVVRPTGEGDHPLGDVGQSGHSPRYATGLVWSPDGETLFYAVRDEDTQRSEFYSLDIESGQSALITDVEGQIWGMALSPNGRSLVYSLITATEQRGEGLPPSVIYCLDVRSGRSSAMSEDTSFNGMASWSP